MRPVDDDIDSTRRWRFLLAGAMALCVILRIATPQGWFHSSTSHGLMWALLLVYSALVWFSVPRVAGRGLDAHLRQIAGAELVATLLGLAFGAWWPAIAIVAVLLLLSHAWEFYVWLLGRGVNPGLVFVGSFIVLIVAGTVTLKFPVSTPPDKPITWVDALFTSTSAVCVTGLVVRDTGTEFTRAGQVSILALIQLGGLGMILFGALVAMLFGSSISLKAVHAMSDSSAGASVSPRSLRRLLAFTALVVAGLELIGAICLYLGWPDGWTNAPPGINNPADRLFHSVFFSISAFCNAGFATSFDNLESLRTHWTSHVVIAGLIFLGGIGLPVISNLFQIAWARITRVRTRRAARTSSGALIRLSLHTRLALITTAIVYLVGAVVIGIAQVAQRDLPPDVALLDGHFMSVSARTAGFDTVAPATMAPLARFAIMLSMFVGGSPGSTAGGIKTIAFAVLMILVWRTILDREEIDAFGRRISDQIIRRAAALFVLHLFTILGVAAVLFVTEAGRPRTASDVGPFESYLFESISACSTVGLSTGVTSGLTDAGKLALVAGMFLGRVGSMAFLVALVGLARQRVPHYQYPAEGVVLS